MASFSTTLHVDGQVFPVLFCTYGVYQETHQRGRVSTKVRYEPVRLRLDVPTISLLLAWMADPHKRLAVDIIFRNAAGGQALETLHLAGAYCVGYVETFNSGDVTTGAYVVDLTLSDPQGFTIQPGGPGAYVAPAPGSNGTPPAAVVVAAASAIVGSAAGGKPGKLIAGTPEHRTARWATYQANHAGDPKI